MTTIYYSEDANASLLEGQSIAVVGYGNQGRPWALNLRDSGCNVRVCVRADETRERAREDGFEAYDIPEASGADVVCLLVPDDVIAAYDAPFPSDEYKAGARQFPALVPITPDDPEAQPNRDAWKVLQTFTKPWLCAFSDQDPVTRGADKFITAVIPGCKGQPHTTIKDGGHFLQEDKGEELASVTVDFVQTS